MCPDCQFDGGGERPTQRILTCGPVRRTMMLAVQRWTADWLTGGISMSRRSTRELLARPIDRRRLLQSGSALGLSAASGLGLSTARYALAQDVTTLKFYHDKAPWQDFFVEQGNLAEAAIGVNWEVTPYSDTTSYQAAVLAALPTDETPDFFTWWSGYRIEDLYAQGVLQ